MLWPAILDAAGTRNEVVELFVRAGSPYAPSAVVAFQNICDQNDASLYSYGGFYVSLDHEKAANYSRRSRTGSELLLFIEEGIKVMRMLDCEFADDLCSRYPELMALYERPAHPVVLAISGIPAERLGDENGGPPSLVLISLHMEGVRGGSFRVSGVTKKDVVGVYDLSDVIDFPSSRMRPADWLLSMTSSCS